MSSYARRVRSVVILAILLTGLVAGAGQAMQDGASTVAVTEVDGPITPVVADHLHDTIEDAAEAGREALVVRLDTPGGLIDSMRDIVQQFLGAPLPVVVFVSPPGADAASAGTFITLASHVAAMAPSTTIGAATPVDLQGGEVGDKVVENAAAYAEAIANARDRDVGFAVSAVREGAAITAAEAVERGVVDLVARDLDTLLAEIDGRTLEIEGREVTLDTARARIVDAEMSWTRRFLQAVADPNLAFIFISIGTLGIVYELANPGVGAGGVVGVIMLVLAMFSLSVLPVSLAGVALLVLAGVLFLLELFIPGIGVAAAGGAASLILGGILLFDAPTGLSIDLWVIIPTAVAVLGLVLLAAWLVGRTRGQRSKAGSDALIGRTAVVHRVAGDRGRVRLDGTWWDVRSADGSELPAGSDVEVVDRDNLDLIVDPVLEKES